MGKFLKNACGNRLIYLLQKTTLLKSVFFSRLCAKTKINRPNQHSHENDPFRDDPKNSLQILQLIKQNVVGHGRLPVTDVNLYMILVQKLQSQVGERAQEKTFDLIEREQTSGHI